jgi:hypothetical protein
MSDDPRTRADARLEAALEAAGMRDPRPLYRKILKHLRERDAAAFERAIRHFDDELVPGVAGGEDPVAAWLAYGRLLADLLGEGRTVEVDGTGRARPAASPSGEGLVLHLPDAADAPALVLRYPRDATAAQDATYELLVLGRQQISDRPSVSGQPRA